MNINIAQTQEPAEKKTLRGPLLCFSAGHNELIIVGPSHFLFLSLERRSVIVLCVFPLDGNGGIPLSPFPSLPVPSLPATVSYFELFTSHCSIRPPSGVSNREKEKVKKTETGELEKYENIFNPSFHHFHMESDTKLYFMFDFVFEVNALVVLK